MKRFILACCLFILSANVKGQFLEIINRYKFRGIDPAERKVTICGNRMTFLRVLSRIEKQTGLYFVHNEGVFDDRRKFRIHLRGVSVDSALKYMSGIKYTEWSYEKHMVILCRCPENFIDVGLQEN